MIQTTDTDTSNLGRDAKGERLTSKAAHVERLLSALGGTGEGWTYTGDVLEQDPSSPGARPCACGHTGIRWLFPFTREDGARVLTGSVCVDTVPGLRPGTLDAMQGALKAHLAARREAARKAREATKAAEVQALVAEVDAAIEERFGAILRECAETRGWLSERLYRGQQDARFWKGERVRALRLKSSNGQATRLRGVLAGVRRPPGC